MINNMTQSRSVFPGFMSTTPIGGFTNVSDYNQYHNEEIEPALLRTTGVGGILGGGVFTALDKCFFCRCDDGEPPICVCKEVTCPVQA